MDAPAAPLLVRATALGELRVLQALVQDGVDINTKTVNGSTPLHIACAKRASAVVSFLLQNGADVGARENAEVGGRSALHIAALVNDAQIVDMLLDAGADPNARDESGRTALHVCAMLGFVTVGKALLSRGADVHMRDASGFNVTFLAKEYSQEDFLALPGLPPPATATIEEMYAARRLRLAAAEKAGAKAGKQTGAGKAKKKSAGKKGKGK